MASLNNCQFIGRLGADPEIRSLNSGDRVCNLRLAVSETWKDRASGERKERTEWVRVVIFNDNIAKYCEQYLRKGSLIFVSGAMQTRKWTDQGGAEKYSTEIVLQKYRGELTNLDGRSEGASGDRSDRSDNRGGGSSGGYSGNDDFDPALDDEIPFLTSASIR